MKDLISKVFYTALLFGLMFLANLNCASMDSGYRGYNRSGCYNCGYNYGGYYNNRYRQYGGYPGYQSSGGTRTHNPFFVPAGRYHNIGRPSHWRL
ncbi:hypothetical protein EHQ53_01795 [Leptospira langatensis]|uniref:Uncharacterized protein n=1 Tax=Leptospira langatensis TaxID=2484983 RepID=A0A5F1ZZB1_9LEPT|nr:hypothetical protein [Leptospira langatensis]TGJ98479.1 hypothetical protein EHO57_17935 [Leptospira langatensis]TGL43393.1 hypothetical protein EHQ53_01795 [Leptospira langatensis]